jgi:signal transduction histidine kinase
LPFSVTLGALCLAGACAVLALHMRRAARVEIARAYAGRADADAALQREEALMSAQPGAFFVWNAKDEEPRVRAGAGDTLASVLEGEKGTDLKEAMDGLTGDGSMFALTVPAIDGRVYHTYGRPAAGRTGLWFRDVTPEGAEAYALSSRLDRAEGDRAAFNDLLDSAPIPMWLRAKDMSIAWANRSYASAAGEESPAAIVAGQVELDRGSRDLAERAVAKGEALREKRYAVVGGARRALDMYAVPVEEGVAGYAVDMTELDDLRRQMQQQLDAHEDTLNKLPSAVAIFGPNQRLIFANKAYAQLWLLDELWLQTKPSDGDILEKLREGGRLPEQREFNVWKRERLSLYTKLVDAQEELWHLGDGKTYAATAAPHPFGGMIQIFADVTDKLALESSFNQLAHVQRASIDALSDGVAVFGTDGRLKLYNQAFVDMWGLPERLLEDKPRFAEVFSHCRMLLPDDGHWSWLTNLIASGATDRVGMYGPFQRTDSMAINFATAPLPDGSLMITARDVTDSAAKEQALEDRNAALLASDRLKSEFISHVSYQLRTPLTSIKGFAQLLKETVASKLSQKQMGYLDDVLAASGTLETLIDDILDLALIEAGRLELDLGDVDVGQVLESVRPLVAGRAAAAQIEISMGVQPELGAVRADEKRLRQIVYNLVINAIEHTPPMGTVTVGVDAVGDSFRLYVSDTGEGIPPEYQPVAFERFESATTTKNARRAGLGLALVRSFVQLHGGWVSLTSDTGKGTTVVCHMPRDARLGLADPTEDLDADGIPISALRIPAE